MCVVRVIMALIRNFIATFERRGSGKRTWSSTARSATGVHIGVSDRLHRCCVHACLHRALSVATTNEEAMQIVVCLVTVLVVEEVRL